jgi:hypothetical protein
MFGTVVEKLQALLSRSFLLGNFFPALIFSALNFGIIWFGIDGFAKYVVTNWPANATDASTALGGILVAVAILAFILDPWLPVFRLALEGAILPRRVRNSLIAQYTNEFLGLRQAFSGAQVRWVEFKTAREQAEKQLGDARLDNMAVRQSANRTVYEAAVAAFEALNSEISDRQTNASIGARLADRPRVDTAITAMAAALRGYPMQREAEHFDQEIFDRLNRMQFELLTRLGEQRDIAYLALQAADAASRERFVWGDIRPTPLANSRAAMEQYSRVAYNVDFQFLWPRLRMVLAKNAEISAAVETATAQLDFAVMVTVLSGLTTASWVVLLPFLGTSVVPFLTVALLGPVVVVFLYRLVDASQQAFGAVAVMAIDGLRFDLLLALHLPLPTSFAAEQKAWEGLRFAIDSALDADIRFRHPKT